MFHKSLSGRLAVVLFGAIALSAHSLPSAHADLSKGPCAVTKLIDVPAKMRDGVTLLANVYRPIEAGSYPVILMRLPYDKAIPRSPPGQGGQPGLHRAYSKNGHRCLAQD
jgi:predicted acyl esterase